MAKVKKFVNLFESYMRRFERGGFLVGDVFKFNDNFKSTEEYKSLGSNVHELLDQMIDSGLHVRVVGIKDTSPARYPANSDTSSLDVVLDIALDNGGGRMTHYCSIPDSLGQPVQYAPNLPPIPDAMRRKDRVTIKPEEAEEYNDSIQNKTDRGNGELSNTERSLPKTNTKIPSKGDAKSTEGKYLTGLSEKKSTYGKKRDGEMLAEAYSSIYEEGVLDKDLDVKSRLNKLAKERKLEIVRTTPQQVNTELVEVRYKGLLFDLTFITQTDDKNNTPGMVEGNLMKLEPGGETEFDDAGNAPAEVESVMKELANLIGSSGFPEYTMNA